MSSFTNLPVPPKAGSASSAFLPSYSKHLDNSASSVFPPSSSEHLTDPSNLRYSSFSTIPTAYTHLASSEASNTSVILPTASKHLKNLPKTNCNPPSLLELLSKHTPSNKRANYTPPALTLTHFSAVALENSTLQSQFAEMKQHAVFKDVQIEGYKTGEKGFVSVIAELKGKVLRVAGAGQGQENLANIRIQGNVGIPEEIRGPQGAARDTEVGIGMIHVPGGRLMVEVDGVATLQEDLSGYDTGDDEEDGGVTLEGNNTFIFAVDDTAGGSDISNSDPSHEMEGSTKKGDRKDASKSTGAARFDLPAAYQNVLQQLQDMPPGYGGYQWSISRPLTGLTSIASGSGLKIAMK
ncbi:hypothetical protein IFR05_000190 [Cadophora sp. M221]|nr:hypothetical protein IFR05_000190 [Cadophora sp. M221]